MRARTPLRILLLALLAAATAGAPASDFGTLLREADSIRSAQPARFSALLSRLEARVDEASDIERQRLRYLEAYRLIVYGNEVEAGIAKAELLFAEATEPDLRFRAGSLVVNGLAINRRFTEGLRYLTRTLALRGRVRDTDIRHDGINAAAAIYNQLGQYALGLKYAEETLADSPNPRARCFAATLRIEALHHRGDLPRDGTSIRAVADECAARKENIVANFARVILARHLAANGGADRAIALLDTHLPEVEALGYGYLIVEFRSLLAELTLARGNAALAERHAIAAVRQEKVVASSLPLAIAYRTLYEIAEARGDVGTALARYRQFAEADKAWLNEAKARELAYQIVRHETLQQSQQIDLLHQQNALLLLQQKVQEQTAQNTRLLMVMLVLIAAFVGLWGFRTKRMQMSLRKMAETDALTEVCNRHFFTQQAVARLAQCARSGEEVALVMFDLDHFKAINDRFGHGTGDWVLRKVVDCCRPVLRPVDLLGRIGGEEFAVLMAGHDIRTARRLADDCRIRLAGIDTVDSGSTFQVTASFGVTTTHVSGYDLTRLLSHADRALYRAKRGGRNRVKVYEGHATGTPTLVVGGQLGRIGPAADATQATDGGAAAAS